MFNGSTSSVLWPLFNHKVSHEPATIEALFVTLFLKAHRVPPRQIVLDLERHQ